MNIHALLRGGAICTAALAAFLCMPLTCSADESSIDDDIAVNLDTEPEVKTYTSGDYTYSVVIDSEDETYRAARIESYEGSETEILIPAELDGLEVVSLGDRAFAGAAEVTKFTLPKTVTEIGEYTFAACTSLLDYEVEAGNVYFEAKDGVLYADEGASLMRYPIGRKPVEMIIPDGVLHIGHVAFADCSSLTSVKFPSDLTFIGSAAFSDCSGLTDIIIPEGVTKISDFTFNSCKNLRSVTLPSQLREIGAAAFSSTALMTVSLPDTLTTIGEQAFIATPMKEITIPRSVTDIGYNAVGWDVTPEGVLYSRDDFIVRGYAKSTAETYVNAYEYENTFKFEALDGEAAASPAGDDGGDETTEPKKSSGVVKTAGIAACVAAILGILAAALLSGRKKKAQPDEKEKQKPAKTDEPEKDDTAETEVPKDET